MNITLDIETIPTQRQDIIDEIRASKKAELDAAIAAIAPPGNYKKQESIDAWMAEEAPKLAQGLRDAFDTQVDDEYRRTGLDGSFGQLCVIGFAFEDDKPIALSNIQNDERVLLTSFNNWLGNLPENEVFRTTIIGHNVCAFDLRFLMKRYVVNRIKPHPIIHRAASAKPWESDKVFDTMIQWNGTGAKPGGSLEKLCKALGIESPKGDITGATVWDAVKAGRIDDVAAYCLRDVEATREAFNRMTFA